MMEAASLMSGGVMVMETVWMDQMKWTVLVNVLPALLIAVIYRISGTLHDEESQKYLRGKTYWWSR